MKSVTKRRNKKRITNVKHSEPNKLLRWQPLLMLGKSEMNAKRCLNIGKINVRVKPKNWKMVLKI